MRNLTARNDARIANAKTYETGIPCKHGHLAPRATATGTCTVCTSIAAKNWLKARPGKSAEYTAKYRDKNRDKVRAADLAGKKAFRSANPETAKSRRNEYYKNLMSATEGREVRSFNRTPIQEVVDRLRDVHKDDLLYVSGYAGMQAPATFLCTTHQQEVNSIPHNVLRGANPCPQCGHMKSKEESRIAQYLSMFTTVVARDRTVIRPKEMDIYMPEKQLAVEYCGMYWHSAFSAEDNRAMRQRHAEKFEAAKAAGVRLLTIYESEWKEREPAIRRLLRNAAGKSKGKLMARKCDLRKVPTPEARVFYEKYHPQGGAGSGEHYGLYWNGALVACMRFVLGANDRGAGASNRVWTLGRYATRITVAGGASRLFKAFLKEFDPEVVKSFSDNRFFDGGMYIGLGFDMEEEVEPDYQVWSQKEGLLPKSHFQRRNIPKRLSVHGVDEVFDPETDPRSEAEMTYLMGCGRIYDCGKKRWVFRKPISILSN